MTGPAWHPARVAVALLTTATTVLTLRAWNGISADPGSFLVPVLGISLLLAGSGLLLRSLRVPPLSVVLGQVLLVGLVLNHLWAASASLLGWVPTPSSVRLAAQVLADAAASAQEWATPVPADVTAFPPLLVGVGVVIALLVEILVGTVRRVPLAGLPLIAALTLPVTLLGGIPALTFAWAALSFALLLAADHTVRLSQWGLGSWGSPDPEAGPGGALTAGPEVGLPSTLPPALGMGVAGVVVALLAPLLLPSGLGLLERLGAGPGGFGGRGGPLELSNPMLNMQRDLVQGADDPLVEVRTENPDPSYLRLTVLDDFDGELWRPSTRDIPPTNQAAEDLPLPPGLRNDTPRRPVRASLVATEQFDSQWLPTPYPAIDVDVEGDWRYDTETLDIVGSETTFTQAEVTSLVVEPDPERLVAAPLPPTSVDRAGTDLPDDMPAFVEETARRVTAGATSDFERVVRMQRWFREEGGFTYTLDTASGNGLEQLQLFLGDEPGSRRGYCEQFASAMTLMARTLDIPARISVGFLEPDQVGPDRWVYSRRDLHAWPEVYFEGAGWMLFDPTPAVRVEDVPGYTVGPLPGETDQAGPTDLPTGETSAAPRDLRRDDLQTPGLDTTTQEGGGPLVPILLVLVLVLVLLAAPQGLRLLARRSRLRGRTAAAAGAVEGAWAEVRATALDLDLDWDDGTSLRRQAVALLAPLRRGHDAESDPNAAPSSSARREVAESLERLVLVLERGRYSRWGAEENEEATALRDAEQVRRALLAAAPPRARRRARLLPASLWRARRINVRGSGTRSLDEREQMLL